MAFHALFLSRGSLGFPEERVRNNCFRDSNAFSLFFLCVAQASQSGLILFFSPSLGLSRPEKYKNPVLTGPVGRSWSHPPSPTTPADVETKLVSLRMRTARLLAFASLRLSDAFAAVTPDKKDLLKVQELFTVRTSSEMRLHGVCEIVVKAQAAKQE